MELIVQPNENLSIKVPLFAQPKRFGVKIFKAIQIYIFMDPSLFCSFCSRTIVVSKVKVCILDTVSIMSMAVYAIDSVVKYK